MASPLIEQREHELAVDVPRQGLMVNGDPTRLAQIFANILTNAAKHTNSGGHIGVRAQLDGDAVVVEITDDGIGIRPEMLPRVFDIFVQERQGLDRSVGGLGLGLSIVKSLVELHGGEVGAHSDGPRRGSRFTVRLRAMNAPVAVVQSSAPVLRAPPRAASAQRVLVVDDNRDAAELLAAYLETVGFEVVTAHDGPSALRVIGEFVPELALLDVGLPVMNGYELATKLKERPELAGTKLVAVTGYGQESDKGQSRAAGFPRAPRQAARPRAFEHRPSGVALPGRARPEPDEVNRRAFATDPQVPGVRLYVRWVSTA